MILVTGGTGFVGQALVHQLDQLGKPVRVLLRPSAESPNLPRGIQVEVAVCSLGDERRLRAAMQDVDTIYHLAGDERKGSKADFLKVDIEGTRTLSRVASEAGVNRIITLSHLGADRASAYPVLKAKAIAESYIVQSGVKYTILRSAVIFGKRDHFTEPLFKLMSLSPGVFLLPGAGDTLLQPIWIEDVVTCLCWILDDPTSVDQTISIGGSEYLTFREICETLMRQKRIKRSLISIMPAYLRILSVWYEQFYRNFPVSTFLLDYLAADRTCPLDTLPRHFGIIPARLHQHLDYL
jgi:NADH dehydrogenase